MISGARKWFFFGGRGNNVDSMGDTFQIIVDQDALESEAPKLAARITNWLIAEGIVLSNATDCTLSRRQGYPPGPHYKKGARAGYEDFLTLWTNGLDVIAERTVFDSGQGGFELVCAACTRRFEYTDRWLEAVDEWYARKGPGILACPSCGCSQPITEWRHDPPWGFANLGFQFWNWPPLKAEFVEAVGKRLGHRVMLVAGKL